MLKNKHLASMLMVSVSAVAMLFASCVREDIDLNPDLPKGAIRLVSEGFRSAGGTKLGVDTLGANVHFIAGDSIWLNGKIYTVQMSGSTPYLLIDETSRHYTDSIAGKALRAVYPARNVHPDYSFDLANSTTIDLIFPDVFRYRIDPATGRQNVEAPLIAYADANSQEITFKHLTAAITVAISNNTGAPMKMEKIRISDYNDDLCLANGKLSIDFNNPSNTGYDDGEGIASTEIFMDFSNANCEIPKEGTAYIQIPILSLEHNTYTARLRIEILSKNMIPNVIENKFYFDKTQKSNTQFRLSRNELAYAPANMHLDSADLKIDGTYTIDDQGHKVYFAKGNLIFFGGQVSSKTSLTEEDLFGLNSPTTRTNWKFADEQYSTYEDAPDTKITSDLNTLGVDGWVSLFLYGANGHDLNLANASHHPLYSPRGVSSNHHFTSLTRADSSDWGVRMGDGWFTLSAEQWEYLFRNSRTASNGHPLYNYYSSVHEKYGVLIFPDKHNNTNASDFDYPFYKDLPANSNSLYDVLDEYWERYENGGVVFLPATGCLESASVKSKSNWLPRMRYNDKQKGYYWSSTGGDNLKYVRFAYDSIPQAKTLGVTSYKSNPKNNTAIPKSFAVRLVYPANFDPAELETSNK